MHHAHALLAAQMPISVVRMPCGTVDANVVESRSACWADSQRATSKMPATATGVHLGGELRSPFLVLANVSGCACAMCMRRR